MMQVPNNFKNSNIEKKIRRTVENTIGAHHMLQTGDAVLVAVSGGPDSVALVHILCALAPKYALKIAIAHLNHCLRPNESDRDQAFVTALARQLEVPIYAERQDVRRYQKSHRLSLEEAARQLRYRFLHRIAAKNGYDKIALGHQSDDNAELVLMFLLRGSGPSGLSGIPPVRNDIIVRPLINLQRSDILHYLETGGLDYVEDSSNRGLQFLRNKIRNRLIPELQAEYNPHLTKALNRLADILDAEEGWIEGLIQPILKATIVLEQPGKLALSVTDLKPQPIAIQRRLIRKAILRIKGNLRRIAFAHIEAVLRLAHRGPPSGMLDLPEGIRAWRDQDRLLISKVARQTRRRHGGSTIPVQPDYRYTLSKVGDVLVKEAGLQIRFSELANVHAADWRQPDPRVAFLDMAKISFPLVIRNFRPGDRFSPLGMSGRQKLKKFFSDHKISRSERLRCPIVLSRNKIIWIAGHRLDNSVKISPQTRRVLKAELSLA